ncbi:MAG: HAD-IA family hydrolase [Ilumatobacteraceae bacterium]
MGAAVRPLHRRSRRRAGRHLAVQRCRLPLLRRRKAALRRRPLVPQLAWGHVARGHPKDAPGDATVCALGNRKNEAFNEIVARDGIDPYPGSMALLDHLDRLGIAQAVVSSSKNARGVLGAAALGRRFKVVVDGTVVADRGLHGKPAPDAFLLAASDLGASPDRSVVVEDAVSGVQAGRSGEFALVIGVDRGAGDSALIGGGADVVVDDLSELIPDSPLAGT